MMFPSNKTPLLGGPAPYGPGIPPGVSFARVIVIIFCFFYYTPWCRIG